VRQAAFRIGRRWFLQSNLALASLSLVSGCGVASLPWRPPAKLPRIGDLAFDPAGGEHQAFRDGLRELGYLEGRTIAIEERWAESVDQFPALATLLVSLGVEALVAAGGTQSVLAAQRATSTIPIVFTSASDPIQTGLVASLARPGGNVTGLSDLVPQMQGRRLQLLREIAPRISRVSYLTSAAISPDFSEARTAAEALGLHFQGLEVRGPDDLEDVFGAIRRDRSEALWAAGSPPVLAQREPIVGFATELQLPLLAQDRTFAQGGGLLSYGPSRRANFRRAATYVDKILKGARPAELPVEQPSTFDLVINLKTARELGLIIPQSVLQQATEIIQ
jgi:putative tryptophan/tyrosine transport system substrate-binding protein